jgi:hypothetical protein
MRVTMKRAILTVLAFAGAVVTSPAAERRKGHSEYLESLTSRSLREGVGRDRVALLAPVAGPGRAVVARRLLEVSGKDARFGRRLQLGRLKADRADTRITSYAGQGGYLDVFADGSKLRMRGNIDDPRELEAAGTVRLEKGELETLGRRFVGDALRELVPLGANESLTFLGVRHLVNSERSVHDRTSTHRTVANIAIFGREVQGVPVVGSGSKVAVWFDNARQPVGFDVDWPVYRVTERIQDVLTPRALAERVAKTTIPYEGGAGQLSRFECGYVDLGATRRGKTVQAGCAISWESAGPEGETVARVEFVPAGAQVVEEPRWPLAAAVAAGQAVNVTSPDFAKWVVGPKAPVDAPDDGKGKRGSKY